MTDNRNKIKAFFNDNLVELINLSNNFQKTTDEILANGFRREIYKWEISSPILFYNQAQQYNFDGNLGTLKLSCKNVSFHQFKSTIDQLIDLVGLDANSLGYLKEVEPSILEEYHMRYWCFDKNFKNIKKYPEEGQGLMISFERIKKESEVTFQGLQNLYYNKPANSK